MATRIAPAGSATVVAGTENAPAIREIAVVTVNYCTADLTAAAVDSVLARDHGGRHVEIHLVDNASPGDDARRLVELHDTRGWGERVQLHLEGENHGFGRGNNIVLDALAQRSRPPDAIFFLNPDARLENETIEILAKALESDPSAGFAGARIEKPGQGPVTAAFRFPGPGAEFLRALSFGPASRAGRRWLVPLSPDHPEGVVDWVAGAAVLARFETLRAIGFFDPVYFLYYEEVDLMRRAARAGWRTLYVPQAEASHAEGAATGVRSHADDRPRRPDYWYRSWRLYYSRNHGRGGALLAGTAWMAGAALNHLLAILPGRQPSAPRRFFGDFWAVAVRPLLGLPERPRD